MTDDARSRTISGDPTPLVAVRQSEVTEPEEAVARTESVQEMYEAGLAKLQAVHNCWAAATAEIREAQVTGRLQEAAA